MKTETALNRIEKIALKTSAGLVLEEIKQIRESVRLSKIKAGKLREYEITEHDGHGDATKRMVTGKPFGTVWAIRHAPDTWRREKWIVDHIPSRQIAFRCEKQTAAKRIAVALVETTETENADTVVKEIQGKDDGKFFRWLNEVASGEARTYQQYLEDESKNTCSVA